MSWYSPRYNVHPGGLNKQLTFYVKDETKQKSKMKKTVKSVNKPNKKVLKRKQTTNPKNKQVKQTTNPSGDNPKKTNKKRKKMKIDKNNFI